ncbi:MAG TPA: hypothetical protein PKW95_15725 [bacterium]|nr:hypothetical protein [bacterium]
MKFKLILLMLIAFILSCFFVAACDDGDDQSDDSDNGDENGQSDDDDDDNNDAGDWTAVDEAGDPVGDSSSDETDIVQLWYRADEKTLEMDLEFEKAYDAENAYIEVYLFHPDKNVVSHTVMLREHEVYWWSCDCSSAKDKHDGCHWNVSSPPQSLQADMTQSGRFIFSVDIEDLDLEGSTVLMTGAGAAPETIQATAYYADRYPDELSVTATEITGLAQIGL